MSNQKPKEEILTPLMLQYQRIKSQYQHEVLFFRLGDFYEMFDSDAVEVSRLLNLTLTHRGDSPMCGIPYHASRVYISRLLRLGKKIAICEQTSVPQKGKGLTERKVVEVISPGTVLEAEYLDQNQNNFIAALCITGQKKKYASFAYMDVSTGEFYATHWAEADMQEELRKELGRINPNELLISRSLFENSAIAEVFNTFSFLSLRKEDNWHFLPDITYKHLLRQFQVLNLSAFALYEDSPEVPAAGCLVEYVSSFSLNKSILPHVFTLKVYTQTDYVILDDSSRRNLEITANLHDGSVKYSLLETVSHTLTPMGHRLLRYIFAHPLCSYETILQRQKDVDLFFKNEILRGDLRVILGKILDIERLSARIAMEKAHAKDVQALRQSLEQYLDLRSSIESSVSNQFEHLLSATDKNEAQTVIELINSAILESPSTSLTEGGIIKSGWSKQLDDIRALQSNSTDVLNEYVETERKKTDIPNLKIRFNRNIGYYMAVTKGKLNNVPEHFILRRALVNEDRYTTETLQKIEQELTGAEEAIIALEQQLFLEIRANLAKHIPYFLHVSSEIAYIDVVVSFATAANMHHWVCPQIEEDDSFEIEGGRHPVVELHLGALEFVPNDSLLTYKKFALVTGPNMAGKSTYLRQNALIVFLAQIGSFVPATKAKIGLVDRIFCRVGASDNLARGESTFLVEMTETALILRTATQKSLVIMDEVGRGTSTEDGLSIAWAVSEYLLNHIKARTFFATHYHELTRLEHSALQLLCLDVRESDNKIVFLKRIREGASENSYGIHVAKLAGIPPYVTNRADEILQSLQQQKVWTEVKEEQVPSEPQIPPQTELLFQEDELIINEILSLAVENITPLEALQIIVQWQKKLFQK